MDIYDDLDNFERIAEDDELKKQNVNLHKENVKLHTCVKEMERKIEQLTQDNKNLLDKFTNIEKNFNSLLHTARAEIDRKTEMINTLNMEKNQLIFRHIGNRRDPTQKRNFCEAANQAKIPKKRKIDDESVKNAENKVPRLETTSITEVNPRKEQTKLTERDTGVLSNIYRSESPSSNDSNTGRRFEKNNDTTKEINRGQIHKINREEVQQRSRDNSRTRKSPEKHNEEYRRRNSRDRFDNSRGSRSSRSHYREEDRRNYSKSSGRYDQDHHDKDRYRRSPSPIRSRNSRNSNRSSAMTKSRRKSPEMSKKYLSKSKDRTRPGIYNYDRKNSHRGKSEDKHANEHASERSSTNPCAESLNSDSNKEDFLQKMEEEYVMHPVHISESQLDEETKDHYHNDSLQQLRIKEMELLRAIEMETLGITHKECDVNVRFCQSPDNIESISAVECLQIKDSGSLTPMDDPRLYNNSYFEQEYVELNKISQTQNNKILSKAVVLNVRNKLENLDLKFPVWEDSKKNTCKENKLVERSDDEMKQICLNIDEESLDTLKSGKVNDKSSQNECKTLIEEVTQTVHATNLLDVQLHENNVKDVQEKTPIVENVSKKEPAKKFESDLMVVEQLKSVNNVNNINDTKSPITDPTFKCNVSPCESSEIETSLTKNTYQSRLCEESKIEGHENFNLKKCNENTDTEEIINQTCQYAVENSTVAEEVVVLQTPIHHPLGGTSVTERVENVVTALHHEHHVSGLTEDATCQAHEVAAICDTDEIQNILKSVTKMCHSTQLKQNNTKYNSNSTDDSKAGDIIQSKIKNNSKKYYLSDIKNTDKCISNSRKSLKKEKNNITKNELKSRKSYNSCSKKELDLNILSKNSVAKDTTHKKSVQKYHKTKCDSKATKIAENNNKNCHKTEADKHEKPQESNISLSFKQAQTTESCEKDITFKKSLQKDNKTKCDSKATKIPEINQNCRKTETDKHEKLQESNISFSSKQKQTAESCEKDKTLKKSLQKDQKTKCDSKTTKIPEINNRKCHETKIDKHEKQQECILKDNISLISKPPKTTQSCEIKNSTQFDVVAKNKDDSISAEHRNLDSPKNISNDNPKNISNDNSKHISNECIENRDLISPQDLKNVDADIVKSLDSNNFDCLESLPQAQLSELSSSQHQSIDFMSEINTQECSAAKVDIDKLNKPESKNDTSIILKLTKTNKNVYSTEVIHEQKTNTVSLEQSNNPTQLEVLKEKDSNKRGSQCAHADMPFVIDIPAHKTASVDDNKIKCVFKKAIARNIDCEGSNFATSTPNPVVQFHHRSNHNVLPSVENMPKETANSRSVQFTEDVSENVNNNIVQRTATTAPVVNNNSQRLIIVRRRRVIVSRE